MHTFPSIIALALLLTLPHYATAELTVVGNKVYIYSTSDFKDFESSVSGSNTYQGSTVYLEADIDLSDYTESIGDSDRSFDGVLDGHGHVIDNLVPGSAKYIGLFGWSQKGVTIRNLVMGENCLFKPQDIMTEPFVGVLVGKCNAVYNHCLVESVVIHSVLESTKAFVRYNYIGAAFGGCEANEDHICHIRNSVNYGKNYFHSGSSNKIDLGGFIGYCKGSSGTVTPACTIENTVNYGSVIYEGSLITVAKLGGFIGRAIDRICLVNVAQFGSVNSEDRLDSDYCIGALIGHSDASSDTTNTISRALWSSTLKTNRNKAIDKVSNTNATDVVAKFDPATFDIESSAGADPSNIVDFFNEYVTAQNAKLLNTKQARADTVQESSSSSSSSNSDDDESYERLLPWVQVSFNSHGGSTVLPRAFMLIPNHISLVYPLETPKKGDAEFEGWYMDDDYTIAFNSTLLEVGKAVTVHAKWSNFDVIFDSNGGDDFSSYNAEYEYNAEFSLPSKVPTRSGHTFISWVPQDAITAINDTHYRMPNHDVTFKAAWSAITITVRLYTWDAEAGTNTALFREYKLPCGEAVRFPSDIPKRAGYTFVSWTSVEGNLTKSGSSYLVPLHDISFTAEWTPSTFTAFFLANDNDTTVQAFTTQSALYGSTFDAPSKGPSKEGHEFAGWECRGYTIETDSSTGKYIMPAQNVTFYAKWTVLSYTVTYLDDTLTQIGSDTVNYGAQVPYPSKTASGKTMYWYLDAAGKNAAPALMPAKEFTAYGIWDNRRYYFTMVTVPGTSGTTSTLYNGDALPIPSENPTRNGYTFVKWSEDSTCASGSSGFAGTKMGTSDITIYACWNALTFTVTLHSNYGETSETKTANIKCGDPFKVDAFARPGYTLAGWCESIDCSTGYFTDTVMPPRSVILYAQWSLALLSFCVDTNYDGSSALCTSATYGTSISSVYTIPRSPEREGYTFVGWSASRYLSGDDSDAFVDVDTVQMPANNFTLYAVWKVNNYVVFFDPGEEVGATVYKEYAYGATINFPTYTREKFSEGGWYTNDTFSEESLFNSTTMPAKNIVLYLRWAGDLYKVTFDTKKGKKMDPVFIEYDAPVNFNREYVPTRDNHIFGGWFLDKKLKNKCLYRNMPKKNIKLYARWKNAAASMHTLSLVSMILCLLLIF